MNEAELQALREKYFDPQPEAARYDMPPTVAPCDYAGDFGEPGAVWSTLVPPASPYH
jgi:hypothetical protein